MAISKGAGARVLGAGLALAIGGALVTLPALGAAAAARGPVLLGPTGILSGHGGQSTGTGAPSPAVTPAVAGVGSPLSEISEVSGGGGDAFGTSVAISGSTAVVGAPAETANGNPAQGVVRIYAKSGTAWVLQAEFTSDDGATEDQFGSSLAITGSILVVGAPEHTVDGHINVGAAYVFTKSGTVWSQTAELVPSDPNVASGFGTSVSISGSTIAVGDPYRNTGTSYEGATYVFTKSGTTWAQKSELTSPLGATGDSYGFSVAVSGTTLVVGSPQRTESSGDQVDQGAVDIYALSSGVATLSSDTTANDGAANEGFGWSVATNGTTVLVGGPGHSTAGAAYVLVKSGTTWSQQAELLTGATGDDFAGISVALSGTTAVVGAPGHVVGTNLDQGAAYVFAKSGTTWSEKAIAVAPDGAESDVLGSSVSDSGTTAIAGAPQHNIGSDPGQGAAYLFES
jgi:hypothetical protein